MYRVAAVTENGEVELGWFVYESDADTFAHAYQAGCYPGMIKHMQIDHITSAHIDFRTKG